MSEIRKAIILAGGLGLRLREIVKDIPKPMALVAGKPFLEYLILQLVKWRINEVILSIGHKGSIIRSYFGNGKQLGIKIRYSEEKEPLGTGGALKIAVGLLHEECFIVMNGDSFLDVDFDTFADFHKKNNAFATIGLINVNDTNRYGRVVVDEDGNIVEFAEKGWAGKGTINGGIYIFDRKVVKKIPSGNVSLENQVLPFLIGHGLYGMVIENFFIDIGVPDDYLYLCKHPEKITGTGLNIHCVKTVKVSNKSTLRTEAG